MKIRVLSLLQDGQKEMIGAVAESAFTAVNRTTLILEVLCNKNILNRSQVNTAEVEVEADFEESLGSSLFVVKLSDNEQVLVDTQLTELS